MKKLPKEILNVRTHFELFEKKRYPEKLRHILNVQKSLDVVNDYLEKDNQIELKEYLVNLKLTFTRCILEQLNSFHNINESDWIKILKVLIKLNSEITQIIKENNQLAQQYSIFIQLYLYGVMSDILTLKEKNSKIA